MEPTEEPVDREVILHDQGRGFDQPPDDPVGAEQGIRPHGIPSATQFGSLIIRMRTHMWISWARIAMKHEAMAHAARQQMRQPGTDQSRLLEQEAEAGLVGICSAAFSLEALFIEFAQLGVIPWTMLAAWTKKGQADEKQILETLKHGVDPRGLVATWTRELKWLFDLRGDAVHYEGSFEPPQLHPEGMNVAPSQMDYSADNATRAVDLLLGILERCRDKPKPPAKQWSQDMRGAVNELIGRRGQAG